MCAMCGCESKKTRKWVAALVALGLLGLSLGYGLTVARASVINPAPMPQCGPEGCCGSCGQG